MPKNVRSEQLSSSMRRSTSARMEMIGRRHLAACRSSNKEARHNTQNNPTDKSFVVIVWLASRLYKHRTRRLVYAAAAVACFWSTRGREAKKKHTLLIVCFLKANVNIYLISLPIQYSIYVFIMYTYFIIFFRVNFFLFWFVVVQSYMCRNSC